MSRRLASLSAPSSPQYIVGTPAKKVMLLVLHQLQRPRPASNRGSITTRAAVARAGRSGSRSGRRSGTAAARRGTCRVLRVGAEERLAEQGVVAHVAVPQLGALGLAGGAGGVEDDRGVVLVGLRRSRTSASMPAERLRRASGTPSNGDSPSRAAVIRKKCSQPSASWKPAYPSCADRQLGGALEAEVGLRVGVVEVVGHLAALEQHVERDHGRAGLEDPPVDERRSTAGWGSSARPCRRAGCPCSTEVGDHVGDRVDLGVGHPPAGGREDDGLPLGVLLRRCPRAGWRGCTSRTRGLRHVVVRQPTDRREPATRIPRPAAGRRRPRGPRAR